MRIRRGYATGRRSGDFVVEEAEAYLRCVERANRENAAARCESRLAEEDS